MKLFLLLSVQAAAAAPAPAPAPSPRVDAIDFDLAHVRPADTAADCDRRGGSEIVVCGRRKGYVYPLAEMAKIYEAKPLRAATGLGNGTTGGIGVSQAGMPDGRVSKRIMVTIKVPF
jgi:hypothetical protein